MLRWLSRLADEKPNPFWFPNETRAMTMIQHWQRMLESPDDSPDMARRGHRYVYGVPDASVAYTPRYLRLFGRKKKQEQTA